MVRVDYRFHRATPERWAEIDPVLDETEIGYERGTGRFKIGDGFTPWSMLPYFTPGTPGGPTSEELLDHINDPNPHPAWDDGIDLVQFYENAKA